MHSTISRTITALFAMIYLMLASMPIAAAADVARGHALFLQYCASCHGPKGEGNGPVARTLTTPPANLRLLSERYGNPLPANQIASFIDGKSDVKAHGTRDMPVWGRRFYVEGSPNEADIKARIADLVAYLQSIQNGLGSTSQTH